jgi:hypothetical protein
MRRRALLGIAIAGCAGPLHARRVPVRAGVYRMEHELHDRHSSTTHAFVITLDDGGAARAEIVDTFVFMAEVEGELERDDREVLVLAGTWRASGDEIDVALDPVRACARGFGEDDCTEQYPGSVEAFRLRCAALAPEAGSLLRAPALVCARAGAELWPKLATELGGEPRLVLYGPEPRA